ncbi:HMA2 domain-containing protein [Marinifilum caeruleilacunae]|uniref:Uncharacterized protein n=1 Tax=Marinifilum caeruleilacunae TaxID=2499076 RepID=A0ABX1WX64_9BACT|nr:hypothetical protein [Marinifilum caeruleilacunae]NOU60718.1 hypothetical protein [Marinifilum caeruleilacunae]
MIGRGDRTMNVVSHIPGRIRCVNKVFLDRKKTDLFMDRIRTIEHVKEVRLNDCIGSILILYKDDESMKNMQMRLKEQWKSCFPPEQDHITTKRSKSNKSKVRSIVNPGMIISFAGTLGALAFDSKKWHIAFGTAFTGIVLGHMGLNRKPLQKSVNGLIGNGRRSNQIS